MSCNPIMREGPVKCSEVLSTPDKEQGLPRAQVVLSRPALKASLIHPALPQPTGKPS